MNAEEEGRRRAEEYREAHHLGRQPLGDLVALIDLLDALDVAVIESPEPDAHGLTVRDPKTEITMLVAVATPNPVRLRSTIAHELGHYLFGDPAPAGDWNPKAKAETRATAFARHLLLPLEAVNDVLGDAVGSPVNEGDLSAIVERFAVSPQMAAIQLRGVGRISENQKKNWMALTTLGLATKFGWGALYGTWRLDSQTVRPPQRLLARAVDGYAQGLLPVETIARLQGITPDAALAALTEAGVVVTPPVIAAEGDLPGLRDSTALSEFDAEFGADA